jgi:uncharacterized protein (TIGR02996 family)
VAHLRRLREARQHCFRGFGVFDEKHKLARASHRRTPDELRRGRAHYRGGQSILDVIQDDSLVVGGMAVAVLSFGASLAAQVAEHDSDDTKRVVFADWIETQGLTLTPAELDGLARRHAAALPVG